MGEYHLQKMEKKLRKYIDADRYQHTLGVMYTAAALAMSHQPSLMERAQVAGLLHDCAKCIPNPKKLKLCEQYHIQVSDTQQKAPYLLHAPLGAAIARDKYDINDEEILSAIACHTTGKPNMTTLEKIIFVADYIEPMRNKAENLERIRQTAFSDLDFTVYLIMRDTLIYLKDHTNLDNMTVVAYNYYKDLMEKREDFE